MEIQKINAGKLKITMTQAECLRYDIKEDGGEFDSTAVRDALPDILLAAGVDADFKVGSEKLLVQLYPKNGGGADLFVTRLSAIGERERRALEAVDNLSTYSRGVAHFYFETIDELIFAAKVAAKKHKNTEIYLSSSGGYILKVPEERLGALSSCDVFLEFGKRLPPTFRTSPEWDKKLYDGDALGRLTELK